MSEHQSTEADTLTCPVCDEPSGVRGGFEGLGDVLRCAACGAPVRLAHDFTLEGARWFWLEADHG